jgi:hypothetical protein
MNPRAASLLSALEPYAAAPGDPWLRLRDLLERHADTDFGRAHGFGSIRSAEDFREAIPPMNYEDHRSWIDRCAAGERGVLACDEPVGFERTSGTSARPKWIPLTAGLRQDFARGLAAWFGGWSHRCPQVFDGPAYWAISPAGMAAESAPGGLPVGALGDAAYFPPQVGQRLAEWLVVPEPAEDFFGATAEALLRAPDLSLVSVWSPTFLLGIDDALRRLSPGRTWRERWPRLARVSCWADASSAAWLPRVRAALGGLLVEPKGLLATEGITSLPDEVDGSPRLAAECHWHEFIDAHGRPVPLDELRPGATYEVLLTTSGGLFRYRSGDRVTVAAAGRLPRLRFAGRAGGTCDLTGEKLTEAQAAAALAGRGFLAAVADRPGYDLWLEDPAVADAVVAELRRNPYFAQALDLRQLAAPVVRRLPKNWPLKLAASLAAIRGGRVGDVKIPALFIHHRPEEVAAWLA